MTVHIIGIDCATDPKRVGLALGRFNGGQAIVEDVQLGSSGALPLDIVTTWLQDLTEPALVALDAPLGWPAPLATELQNHKAGDAFNASAHELFRRATDRFVRETLGKQSLDVGADRIARTAHAALDLLGGLRQRLNNPIPLVWNPDFTGIGAIEVYPAATLRAHHFDATGYKATENRAARERVLRQVDQYLTIQSEIPGIERGSDGLDAVLCVLAGVDFLRGDAISPPVECPVEREGWIWVRDPEAVR